MRRSSFFLALALSQGCRCSTLAGEAGDHGFTRCVQADPPVERTLRAGARTLKVTGRVAELSGPLPLRIAAFTGPVGASLSHTDAAELAATKPAMVWMLGGFGDTAEAVAATLAELAGLGVPVLLVPGGADRHGLVAEALRGLAGNAADLLIDGAGLHALIVGSERLALVSGAPDGRYALSADACGFSADDTRAVAETLGAGKGRTWLVSWAAPSGLGLTRPAGADDIGSASLAELAKGLSARGGVYAWPEGSYRIPAAGEPLHVLVPRLGRTGSLAEGGGRLGRGVLMLHIDASGLSAGP